MLCAAASTFVFPVGVALADATVPGSTAVAYDESTAGADRAANEESAEAESLTSLAPLVVAGTALKVEVPVVDTPRSVSVVDQEELQGRNVQSLDETLRYRAGVLSGQYGADNNTDWFKVRGFDQTTYQDGLRIYQEGFYGWQIEPYGLSRVEVFKGPSSILYGEAPPGGLINAVSKRPTDEPQGRVDFGFGTRNFHQVGFDTSGPVNDSDKVQYRLVGTYKERDGELAYTDNTRYYIAPSLNIDFSSDTSLTLLSSFQHDDGVPTNPFKLAYGTVDDTPFGKVDPRTNYSEPAYDRNRVKQTELGYQFEHAFNDTWTFKQNVRYSHQELFLRSSYILARSGARKGTRGLVYRDGDIDAWALDNQVIGNWEWGHVANTLLAGVDYQHIKLRAQEADLFSFGEPIDLFDPQYGNFDPVGGGDLNDRRINGEQTGLYLQDQLTLYDRLILLGGMRYDMADQDNINRTTDVTQSYDVDHYSFTGGILYHAGYGLSPYFSYTESFQPLGRTTTAASQYKPREGTQYEVGLKFAPDGWDGYASLAAYDLEETNTLITSAGGFQVQAGERQSKGIEFETVGYVTDELQVIGAYNYTHARVDLSESQRGVRAPLIPRHQASLRAEYTFAEGPLRDFGVGGGARYVGESVDGDITVPDHTVFDALARYDLTDQWRIQVNATNILDKEYVSSCDYWCYYGESRSVIGNLSYRW
ncbi:TonB-dependent siderophore receptor [Salinisphaera aquimarina]